MIVVKIFKDNAKKFANLTTAVTFEDCKRRLRLYFSDLEKVKERIIAGGIIDLPDLTLQRDRRVDEEKRVRNERRRHLMHLSRKRREEKRLAQSDLASW
jgi:dsDNA-specific endonuclease/ATPase MutS2